MKNEQKIIDGETKQVLEHLVRFLRFPDDLEFLDRILIPLPFGYTTTPHQNIRPSMTFDKLYSVEVDNTDSLREVAKNLASQINPDILDAKYIQGALLESQVLSTGLIGTAFDKITGISVRCVRTSSILHRYNFKYEFTVLLAIK